MTEIEDFYPSIVDNYESRRKKILSNIDEDILTNFVIDLSKEKFTDRNKYDKYINKLKRKYKINPRKVQIQFLYKELLKNGMIIEKVEDYFSIYIFNSLIFLISSYLFEINELIIALVFGFFTINYLYFKNIEDNNLLTDFSIRKIGKSHSGVSVITVLTSPFPKYIKEDGTEVVQKFSCGKDCAYCPKEEAREENNWVEQPRSYISSEPAVSRANRNNFDAVAQFFDRANALELCGHPIDKIEILILGGTWSHYPQKYKEQFCRDIYYSANIFNLGKMRERLSLEKEIEINETADVRIIGLTIETRPDCINKRELIELRNYGVTRVQIGIQHLDDDILTLINRRCSHEDTVKSIELLKSNCFKIDIHIMPDLPGTSPEIDKDMFDKFLSHDIVSISPNPDSGENLNIKYDIDYPELQVDQWKIYPTMVTRWTKIKEWYDADLYKPYSEEDNGNKLIELLIDVKQKVFPWIRLNRIIRDIPSTEIYGGTDKVNMRQDIHKIFKSKGYICNCIRCREVKTQKYTPEDIELVVREYHASNGIEYFISFESKDRTKLIGFLRLRINYHKDKIFFPELMNCSLIRELHVYGQLVKHNEKCNGNSQHFGFGKRLLKHSEKISKTYGIRKIAVISGVGVKDYYKKQGFKMVKTFMIKDI